MLDSCGKSWTGETPEAQPRRLTASPAESEHLERKSTSTRFFKSNYIFKIEIQQIFQTKCYFTSLRFPPFDQTVLLRGRGNENKTYSFIVYLDSIIRNDSKFIYTEAGNGGSGDDGDPGRSDSTSDSGK